MNESKPVSENAMQAPAVESMNDSSNGSDQNGSTANAALQRDLLLASRKRSGRNRLLIALVSLPIFLIVTALAIGATRAVDVLVFPNEASTAARIELEKGLGLVVGGKLYLFGSAGQVRISSPTYITASVAVQPRIDARYVEVVLEPQPARLELRLEGDAAHLANTRWYLNEELAATGTTLSRELAADQYDVRIDHPFYQVEQRSLSLDRGELVESVVTLVPVPVQMQLASSPNGAQVRINGEPAGNTNLQLDLLAGEYQIEVQLKDHSSISEHVVLQRTNTRLERDYRLLVNAANLAVRATPAGGTLLLNGRAIAPDSEQTVSARKEHVLTYEKPGFHTLTQRLELAPGERHNIAMTLAANVGDVRIQSEPAARVAINGRDVGETPLTLQLPAVPHQVTLTKPGYHTERQTITPTDSAQKLVNLTLLTELEYRLRNMPRQFQSDTGLALRRFQPSERIELGAPRSDLGQRANETVRSVRLDKSFYVSQTEVTNGQFAQFARATGLSFDSGGGANLPRTNVSWQQAAAFCNYLSEREGLTPIYRFANGRVVSAELAADGYRLPTEAEWEWLARKAGRRTVSRFTWGDDYQVPTGSGNLADESARAQVTQFVAQYTDGFAGVAPVASFAADSAGLFDMTGNVSEWVHDFYEITPSAVQQERRNPAGPAFGEAHVIKGSSWRSATPTALRAAFREPGSQARDDLGFRVLRYVYGAEDAERAHSGTGSAGRE